MISIKFPISIKVNNKNRSKTSGTNLNKHSWAAIISKKNQLSNYWTTRYGEGF